jgi:hypothetical protein
MFGVKKGELIVQDGRYPWYPVREKFGGKKLN